MAIHFPGNSVDLLAEFRNPAGTLVDPDTVTVRVKKPGGTIITPSAAQQSTGVYLATVPKTDSDEAGEYVWEFEGVGTNPGLIQGRFVVNPSGI